MGAGLRGIRPVVSVKGVGWRSTVASGARSGECAIKSVCPHANANCHHTETGSWDIEMFVLADTDSSG